MSRRDAFLRVAMLEWQGDRAADAGNLILAERLQARAARLLAKVRGVAR